MFSVNAYNTGPIDPEIKKQKEAQDGQKIAETIAQEIRNKIDQNLPIEICYSKFGLTKLTLKSLGLIDFKFNRDVVRTVKKQKVLQKINELIGSDIEIDGYISTQKPYSITIQQK